jgi:hypothetical protein
VSKLGLTLDGFVNDLYKQSIFWFNGCLNASFIIYCLACNYCLKLPYKVLQYRLSAQSFGVAIYAITTNKRCGKKPHSNEIVGMAIESPNYSNTIVSMTIES